MKTVPMNIDEMTRAKVALDQAIQRAMMIMTQKAAFESTVTLKLVFEIDPISNYPKIHYKTNIRVPIELGENGQAVNASAIEWDEDKQRWMMDVEGEQMEIRG